MKEKPGVKYAGKEKKEKKKEKLGGKEERN